MEHFQDLHQLLECDLILHSPHLIELLLLHLSLLIPDPLKQILPHHHKHTVLVVLKIAGGHLGLVLGSFSLEFFVIVEG